MKTEAKGLRGYKDLLTKQYGIRFMLLSWISKRNESGPDFTSNVRGARILRCSVLSTTCIVLVFVSSFIKFD